MHGPVVFIRPKHGAAHALHNLCRFPGEPSDYQKVLEIALAQAREELVPVAVNDLAAIIQAAGEELKNRATAIALSDQ